MATTDKSVWLISADNDVLHFSLPEEIRRGLYAVCWLLLFCMIVAPMMPLRSTALYEVELGCPIIIAYFLYLGALSDFIVNLETRTYEIVSRGPWSFYTTREKGSLNDFKEVYVSVRGSVFLVSRKPGLRHMIGIGGGGFGSDATTLAQEVAARMGLQVKSKLRSN